jgi:phage repressor protein C with HTH and peptisase S24 domain
MIEEDLSTPGKRLKFARIAKGYAEAKDFARKIGMNPTTYRAYENDQNGYTRHAHDFADQLGVEASWLLRGGDAPEPLREDTEKEIAAKDLGLALVPQLELGYSMGGGSVFADYRHMGAVPFDRNFLRGMMRGNFADLFVAQGAGDSMLPTMMDGDIVLIDTSQRRIEQQDRIWALSYGDLGMIKRVRRLPGGTYRIMSDNPAVTPIDAADDEMHVVGRVV